MELYHITKEKHLASILIQGLQINSNKIGFCKKESHKRYKEYYNMQPIFLTNDIEFISKTMLTNGWVKKHKAIVLKVDVELNESNSSKGWYNANHEPMEFRYFLNIEPENIEVIDFLKFNLEY